MKVLVACEYSGVVRDAFIARGHDAMSCDLLPTDSPGPHYQGDVFDIINDGWDLLCGFPPCTHLCSSGARWWKDKQQEQKDAIKFVLDLYNCNIPKVSIENPVGILSTVWRKPDCIIQPYEHGHGETKKHVCGLKIYLSLNLLIQFLVENKKYGNVHRDQIDGKLGQKPMKGLQNVWLRLGDNGRI